MLERLAPKLATRIGVRLQRRRRSAQPLDFRPQSVQHQPWISRAASSA